ncbi:hypothetical protein KJ707_00995 [Patescibacteria group bacterium]|nr:hypothetical protein [Patescibacteria group bacterium]MBU1967025.1 hypothetical protein [Patescibacteria group bacterium]MBU2543130.1 hypothetical protein [Patescibacteria group bacterium]
MTKIQQLAAITNPILKGKAGSDEIGAKSGSLFFQIISGILQFMMLLGALLVLINLILAGIEWIGSGGDKGKLETARGRITSSLIGLLVLSASFALWILIKEFLGIEMTFKPLFP